MKIGLCVPGQGYQRAGLLAPWARVVPPQVLDQVDSALPKLKLSRALLDPAFQAVLTPTSIAQPLMLAASYAIYGAWRLKNEAPSVAIGHSLGEISTLTLASSLEFTDALRLVHARGLAMEAAATGTGMTLVVKPRKASNWDDQLAEVCHSNNLDLANHNSQTQTVLSGDLTDLRNAVEKLQGWQRTVAKPLDVSGAFHSRYMQRAQPELERLVEKLDIKKPKFTIVSNKTAKPFESVDDIRASIPQMLVSPVLWWQSAGYMAGKVDKIVSLAPGKIGKMTAGEYKTPTEYYEEPEAEGEKASDK